MELQFIGMACALGLAAIGSAFGAGYAAMASVGAWKKCYASGKPAPFMMVAFSGAPLTQTIYGFLLMSFIRSAYGSGAASPTLCMFVGIFAGLAIGLSALFQGKVAAAAADALGEGHSPHQGHGIDRGGDESHRNRHLVEIACQKRHGEITHQKNQQRRQRQEPAAANGSRRHINIVRFGAQK